MALGCRGFQVMKMVIIATVLSVLAGALCQHLRWVTVLSPHSSPRRQA